VRRIAAAAIVTVGLLGCGDDSRAVSPAASAALQAHVQELRAAVAAGDLPSATLSLSDLRARAATLREQGELNDAAMERILNEAAAVEQNLVLIPTPTAAPTPTPAATAAPPDAVTGNGNGNGNGNGKPKDKEERGDDD
jgi:hypothetical protein